MVKIVRITVDPSKLDEYKRILNEEIEASLRLEKDVHVLYAAWDNKNPNQFTILEVYKDQKTYDEHCASPQLQKYFVETKDMVQHIETMDATPLIDRIWMK